MSIQHWNPSLNNTLPTILIPYTQVIYKAPNDFGRVIHELLFAKSEPGMSDFFLTDLKLVAEIEGFKVTESRDSCPVRDYRIMLNHDEFLSPNVSNEVREATDRCYKKALFCKDNAQILCSSKKHGYAGMGMVAFDGKTITSRNEMPSEEYPNELPPPAKTQSSQIYFEGGNLFTITGRDGKKRIICGEDNHIITHQIMRLGGLLKKSSQYFEGRIPQMIEEIGKKITPTLNSKDTNRTLSEMASMGLIAADFTVNAESTKIAVNYLAQKQFVEEIAIPTALKVEPNQMVYLPQIDYHLDCLMTPGPNGTILLQDYQQSLLLLEKIKKELTEKNDRDLINQFIFVTKNNGEKVKQIMEKANKKLELSGFTVIPTPGAFFAPPRSEETQIVNFFNAISGFSPKTNCYYYIVGGTSVGTKLGTLLMDAHAQFLQSLSEDKIHVYYVGRNPEKPSDFSMADKVLNHLDVRMGVHCCSLETAIGK